METYKITVIVCATLLLSGCSTIKSRFFKKDQTLNTTTLLSYNFAEPRRSLLTPELISRYKLSATANSPVNRLMYFSANGNKCQTLSLTTPKAACLVNDRWTETAPVLVGNIPQ